MMKTITRNLKTERDVQLLTSFLAQVELPSQVRIKPGTEPRTERQNRLQFQWYKDAQAQGDQTAEEYRAYCKLHFGVPLLRAEDDQFKLDYDLIIRPLNYEQKIAAMVGSIDLPVTSRMKVKTFSEYLHQVQQHFLSIGFQLTDPAMLGIDDYASWSRA